MARGVVLLVALWLNVVAANFAVAQSAPGEATPEDYAKAWRLAAASLGATASVPVSLSGEPAARGDAIERFADYCAKLNNAVIVLVRLRPPADSQMLRMHFALLPLFQEAAAASAAWLDALRATDEDEARLAEEWFWSVATRIHARTEALEK